MHQYACHCRDRTVRQRPPPRGRPQSARPGCGKLSILLPVLEAGHQRSHSKVDQQAAPRKSTHSKKEAFLAGAEPCAASSAESKKLPFVVEGDTLNGRRIRHGWFSGNFHDENAGTLDLIKRTAEPKIGLGQQITRSAAFMITVREPQFHHS